MGIDREDTLCAACVVCARAGRPSSSKMHRLALTAMTRRAVIRGGIAAISSLDSRVDGHLEKRASQGSCCVNQWVACATPQSAQGSTNSCLEPLIYRDGISRACRQCSVLPCRKIGPPGPPVATPPEDRLCGRYSFTGGTGERVDLTLAHMHSLCLPSSEAGPISRFRSIRRFSGRCYHY